MKFIKYIISVILIITILFSSVFAVEGGGGHADPGSGSGYNDYRSVPVSLWDRTLLRIASISDSGLLEYVPGLSWLLNTSTAFFSAVGEQNAICDLSDDRHHHANTLCTGRWGNDEYGTYIICTCTECGEDFRYYTSDLHAAYDSYVDAIEADLGTTTVNNNGGYRYYFIPERVSCPQGRLSAYNLDYKSSVIASSESSDKGYIYLNYSMNSYKLPIIAYVSKGVSNKYMISYNNYYVYNGIYGNYQGDYYLYTAGSIISNYESSSRVDHYFRNDRNTSYSPPAVLHDVCSWWLDIIPYNSEDFISSLNVDISPSTRIGSIPGNIGYLDTSTNTYIVTGGRLINEDNRTIYNPITDTTTTYEDYTYNYDNRSYTFNTGDTITYGDEHITYITNEGDTYNFYYYVQPSEPTPSPGPGTITTPDNHNWVQDSQTAPTCTEPGIITYHCTDCGETKTEKLDALGHDWIETESQPDTYSLPPGTACPDCGSTDLDTTLVTDQYHCTCHDCQREFVVTADVEYGYKKYVCSRCGMEMTEDNSYSSGLWSTIGDFLAHSVEWVVEKLRLLAESLSGLTDAMDDASDDILDATVDYPEFITEAVGSFPAEFMRIIWAVLIIVVVVLVFCKIIK